MADSLVQALLSAQTPNQYVDQNTPPLSSFAPPSSNFADAIRAMNLNPQEQALYARHLSNLYGPGGVDNGNGSRSTLYQSVEPHDGKFYNVPTVWNGQIQTQKWTNPKTGQVFDIPNSTAMQNINQAGWDSFPSYDDPDAADARYLKMHDYMERDTAARRADLEK